MAWNILHGGGPRRVPEIVLTILEAAPDVVLLSEFRPMRGGAIRGALADHGLCHQMSTDPPAGRNGLLLASRWAIEATPEAAPRALRHRWICGRVSERAIRVAGVHVPEAGTAQAEGLRHVAQAARRWRDEAVVLLGDFNAGRPGLDTPASSDPGAFWLGLLATAGYEDAWRIANPAAREGTWRSHTGASFRLDHVYVSAGLRGRVAEARHLDGARATGVSDHAPVVVDLS